MGSRRDVGLNDLPIKESDRVFLPLGRHPEPGTVSYGAYDPYLLFASRLRVQPYSWRICDIWASWVATR